METPEIPNPHEMFGYASGYMLSIEPNIAWDSELIELVSTYC